MLPDFLSLYPRVQVQIVAIDRPVDLIAERIDVALRVRVKLDTDATLTMRTLARSRRLLFASPVLANTIRNHDIATLASLPTLSSSDEGGETVWTLKGPNERTHVHTHVARFGCSAFEVVRDAAVAGLGVALLPEHTCIASLRSGALVRVFSEWTAHDGIVHLVFTTRTGLPPVVRAWIDHLAMRFRDNTLFSS